jgi:type III pantothenate kinase
MILVIDVGNSETTLGLFQGEVLRAHWRVFTDQSRTSDELALLLRGLLDTTGLPLQDIRAAALASVVPALTEPLGEACQRLLGKAALVIDAASPLPIKLDVLEPLTVGADRIVNTLAASRLYRRDTIVVDLGTATTFDCITEEGVFLGGVIAPGVRSSAETLVRRTSKLPATELVAPQAVIGRRTEECIRAGVIYGAAASVDGIVRRIKDEWPTGRVPLVVATGGLATLIQPHCREIEVVKPDLTLIGLRIAYECVTRRRAGDE